MKQLTIGLLGYGTVGSGVADLLWKRRKILAQRIGAGLTLKWVCARGFGKKPAALAQGKPTRDPLQVVDDPEVQILIELFGGIEPTRTLILRAIEQGKHIVTANKALLAEHGSELYAAAAKRGVHLWYEASVAGGIPIIKSLREGLAVNRFNEILGILNGTSNYILSRMSEAGMEFRHALAEAQAKGFAERDPSLDIDGVDAAHKLAILARLGFGYSPAFKDIYVEGIRKISQADIQYAREMGYCIKPLAVAKRVNESLELRVHPTLLPEDHVLSDVDREFNAIYVDGDQVGPQLFYGRGAGKYPTASAVLSDVIAIGRSLVCGGNPAPDLNGAQPDSIRSLRDVGQFRSRYYFRFLVKDRPGVMASLAGILGENSISIASVSQKERHAPRLVVPVVIMSHEAQESNVKQAMEMIKPLRFVQPSPVVIRVEDPEE